MKATVDVLECFSGNGKKSGQPFHIALVRFNGRVGKVFSALPLKVDDQVDVVFSLSPNSELFLSPRIESLSE